MRSLPASLVTLALVACGSATGELPNARTPGGPADAQSAPTADTNGTGPPDGLPPVAFADPVTGGPGAGAPVSDGPFAAPDPEAATLVARFGHVRLRALAEHLVTARFADAYLAVDASVLALIEADRSDALPVVDGPPAYRVLDCPAGGRLEARRGPPPLRGGYSFELLFDDCRIGGTTLSGILRRTETAEGGRRGSNETLALDYRGLVVDDGTERATLRGTTRRSVARRTDDGCGGEDVGMLVAHAFAEVELERDGSLERLLDARHERLHERAHVAPVGGSEDGTPDCRELVRVSFEGRATVYAERFGQARATLARQGRIVRDARAEREPPASATLAVDVDDGSRLALELLSDRAGTARLDLCADAVAVSFETRYRFEPDAEP